MRIHILQRAGVEGDGVHHDLHHANARHAKAADGAFLLALEQLLFLVRMVGVALVADTVDLTQQAAEAGRVRIPAKAHAVIAQIDAYMHDPRLSLQVVFEQPAAGGAGNAFDDEACFTRIVFKRSDKGLLDAWQIIQRQFLCQGVWQGAPGDICCGGRCRAGRCRTGAMAVVVIQPAVDDGLCHGQAAGAAKGTGLAINLQHEAGAGRNIESAVKAGLSLLLGVVPGGAGFHCACWGGHVASFQRAGDS